MFVLVPLFLLGCDDNDNKETCHLLPSAFPQDTVLSGCYEAQQTPTIADGVTITLEPGTVISFAENTGFTFSEGHTLIAAGTEANPILLTGMVKERGSWLGLRFDMSDSTENALEYVTIEYAGSTTADNDPDSAAVKLTSDSRPVTLNITNSIIRESDGWGLWLNGSSVMPLFSNNVFTANTLGPASIDSSSGDLLDAGSAYTGNDIDMIRVRTNQIDENATWAALDVPYFITAGLNVNAQWTLSPGVTLVMGEEAWISVNGDLAALNAVGTMENPILITGEEPTAGYWSSIHIDGSNNGLNAFEYVTVEYGGGGEDQYDLGQIVAVSDSHGVTLDVANCTIRSSSSYGIYLGFYADYNDDIETSNTFSDNTSGDVFYDQ
ncbi:hypothetical protein KKF84_05435 [Myxococcota bacterium]|nr:hypothetical protein [Myxococcota bacterium]MBU1534740.1 hypothetical protein [Myxococcota bacterium]